MKIELSTHRSTVATKWHSLIRLARLIIVYQNTGIHLSFSHFEDGGLHYERGDFTFVDAEHVHKISDQDLFEICFHESNCMTSNKCQEVLNHTFKLMKAINEPKINDIKAYVENSQFVCVLCSEGGRIASIIHQFHNNLSWENDVPMSTLLYLNKMGHLWASYSSSVSMKDQIRSYKRQVLSRYKLLLDLEYQLMPSGHKTRDPLLMFFSYKPDEIIPIQHLVKEPVLNDLSKFDVIVDWAPGFYSLKNLPLFTLGVSYTVKIEDKELTFIQISSLLKDNERVGGATRTELIVHEQIHACRSPLKSKEYEEEFAYKLSSSIIRKVLAPVTRHPADMLAFTAFSAVSVVSDFPSFPRWFTLFSKIPVLFSVCFAMYRLLSMKRRLKAAIRNLEKAGALKHNILPVLLRMTDQEINELSRATNPSQTIRSKSNIRWKVIQQAYLS
ncbi:TruB [Acrasis kona]|uniref:TruB n=1 Tax=Acrasis kona TaxID=1008807 RepID=A0AAW2ZG74_9EUKA